jgi:hypothetical protein
MARRGNEPAKRMFRELKMKAGCEGKRIREREARRVQAGASLSGMERAVIEALVDRQRTRYRIVSSPNEKRHEEKVAERHREN